MGSIDKNPAPAESEVNTFLEYVNFRLPDGFMDFYKVANGAFINTEENYLHLWPLTEMVQLNVDYAVDEFAPTFFAFGSNGGDTCYLVERATGFVFEMPFIGMAEDEATFVDSNFSNFLKSF
ncbi:MAG: SMI1/KNR4 family protein [Flavipsychrobacter sp.]|nr:SMI1/KNR4 family protein [Flavipsychrobacter sp.]